MKAVRPFRGSRRVRVAALFARSPASSLACTGSMQSQRNLG